MNRFVEILNCAVVIILVYVGAAAVVVGSFKILFQVNCFVEILDCAVEIALLFRRLRRGCRRKMVHSGSGESLDRYPGLRGRNHPCCNKRCRGCHERWTDSWSRVLVCLDERRHPVILASGSPDWHLFRFSCLLCPIAATAAPNKRQVHKADLRITFDAPCSRIGSKTKLQALSHPATFRCSGVGIQNRQFSALGVLSPIRRLHGSGWTKPPVVVHQIRRFRNYDPGRFRLTRCMPQKHIAGRTSSVVCSAQRAPMRASATNSHHDSSRKRWNRAFARAIAPRQHLRVLPTRTRPSLFGSD